MKKKQVLVGRLGRWMLLALGLAGPGRGWAQAPAWNLAVGGNNNLPGTGGTALAQASAVDGSGNVFITGSFSGSVTFGNTRLTSAGASDMFVAKWDATAQVFTWATSGGGSGGDTSQGIAVHGTGVYVTGFFESGTNIQIAGQALTGAGSADVFVAKYVDTSTGNTPATSSFANAWVISDGGTGSDGATSIAVSGTGVYVTGYFAGGRNAIIAGQMLAGIRPGFLDMFVAKYVDTSTGSTTATSSFANAWATSGGGSGNDYGQGIAVRGTDVYVTGYFASGSNTTIAGQTLTGAGGNDMFVAKYVDTSIGSTPATSSFANAWATRGGGIGDDSGEDIAVSSNSVYVTGFFYSGGNTSIAGQALAGAGGPDMFVAKYVDTSTGSTTATSSFANAWATSGGGNNNDLGVGIAVSGANVFVTGYFTSSSSANFSGQALTGAGSLDVFVAKYGDTSTGSNPATSSFANAWAVSGGGTGNDIGYSIVVSRQQVYATGGASSPATFGSITLGATTNGQINFLARLTDPTLPLATPTATPAIPGLTLAPNPARTACTVQGAPAGAALAVLDALGRPIATATADATGTARLALPAGLPPGVYIVRGGGLARRLAVE